MDRHRRHVKKVLPDWDGREDDSTEEEEDEDEEDDDFDDVEAEDQEMADQEVEEEEEDAEDGDDGQEDAAEEEAEDGGEGAEEEKAAAAANGQRRKKITIKLKANHCKVCKKPGHQAGFMGSIYFDCPNKPCFLCKKPGHTTMTCPHKAASEYGVTPVPRRQFLGLHDFVGERQLKGQLPQVKIPPVIPSRVDAAMFRLHKRRITSVEFHPTKDNIVISGDKGGEIGIWDFENVVDKTVYDNVHTCLVNSIKFHPHTDETIYTSSSDGTIHSTDLETGLPTKLMDMNPDGWNGPSTWKMMYAMDLNPQRNLLLTADNVGNIYRLDLRTGKSAGSPLPLHDKGTKVVGMNCNPVEPDLFITSGNDHTARVWDLRTIDSQENLARLDHSRVVNSAYFSPVTGSKVLTTCIDNRLRVWDSLFGDLSEPSREIVHSHDFNRYLTPFKAEWDPKDRSETVVVVGRYISDDFDGTPLHPVDFIDISNGHVLAEVVDPNIKTISPVNKLHPRQDVMISGSSRSLFLWRPPEEEKDDDNKGKAVKKPPRIAGGTWPDDDLKKGKGGKHGEDWDNETAPKTKKQNSKAASSKADQRKRK